MALKVKIKPKLFVLHRHSDSTGVSGIGEVAWGVEFPDGSAVLRWHADLNGQPHCTSLWDSVKDIKRIHGHGGDTEVVYVS